MQQTLALGQDNTTLLLPRALEAELQDVMSVQEVHTQSAQPPAVLFYGTLLVDPDSALSTLEPRFAPHGMMPLIRRQGKQDIVVAVENIASAGQSRLWVHGVLFLATVMTTMLAGATIAGVNVLQSPLRITEGLPFAFTLLLILGTHELGHYFMGKWHGVRVSLPYFIPMPVGLGTFGAFIQMRSPIRSRSQLFDVGFAGPVAGFVVAVPMLIVGLLLSEVVRRSGTGAATLGSSLLIEGLTNLLAPHGADQVVRLHQVAIAAYFGILLTGVNLLPAGQLDGGHISYALFGSAARPLAVATVAVLVLLGVFFWSGWYIWAALIFFTGLRHTAPLDDVTPLDRPRKLMGLGALVIFALTFIPKPF